MRLPCRRRGRRRERRKLQWPGRWQRRRRLCCSGSRPARGKLKGRASNCMRKLQNAMPEEEEEGAGGGGEGGSEAGNNYRRTYKPDGPEGRACGISGGSQQGRRSSRGVPPLQPLYRPSTLMLPQRSLLHLLPCPNRRQWSDIMPFLANLVLPHAAVLQFLRVRRHSLVCR